MNALIIDDDEDVRAVVRASLGQIGGFNVVEAANGPDGVRLAAASHPDVILLDMMMPGSDGASTLHALRANPATAAIPVIFLTAKAMRAEVRRLTSLGAKGVIVKPFNPMTLAHEVRTILQA